MRTELHVGDIDQSCFRTEGHILPVMRADRARPDIRIPGLVADILFFNRTAGLEIDPLGPGYLAGLLSRDELSGLAIEHVEEPIRRAMQQDFARFSLHRDR